MRRTPTATPRCTAPSASVIAWLDALPGRPARVVLWTGTNPVVMGGQTEEIVPLQDKLAQQEATFAAKKPADAQVGRAYVQALSLASA